MMQIRLEMPWVDPRQSGNLILLSGFTEDNRPVTVATDYRPGLQILEILKVEGEMTVQVEPWPIL